MDFAPDSARLIFSCGWHITADGEDVCPRWSTVLITVVGWIATLVRIVDINDQVVACRRIAQSETNWSIVRGSNLEEGESQGLPVWSRHV